MDTIGMAASALKLAFSVIIQPAKITRLDVKSQIVKYQSGATLAAFIAAVQAQVLSFSIQDNTNPLHLATNTLAFIGLILDVLGAFLALLASTLIQTDMLLLDSLMDGLKYTMLDQFLAPGTEEIMKKVYKTPLGSTIAQEITTVVIQKAAEAAVARNSAETSGETLDAFQTNSQFTRIHQT